MDRREMLDKIYEIYEELKNHSENIKAEPQYQRLIDIAEKEEGFSKDIMDLWEKLGGKEDVAEREKEDMEKEEEQWKKKNLIACME